MLLIKNGMYGSMEITLRSTVFSDRMLPLLIMIMEDKFFLASIIILVAVNMCMGTWPGKLFIHMHAWSPALMIPITNYVIRIMRTVSEKVNFHCLFCFFRGIKAVLENLV